MDEFDLIERYFRRRGLRRDDVAVGIGDDTAVVRPPAGHELVVTVDTLVAGVHFPESASATDIGHKALAVSLSDLAAMGAQPAWATLTLTLPSIDETWIDALCDGFFALATDHGVELIGGDTTRGPLNVSVTAYGLVPAGTALTRGGAQPGDAVYVTGSLGDAGMGLAIATGERQVPQAHAEPLVARLHRPAARVREGLALRGRASAVIDVSDGLAADLSHLLEASHVGASVDLQRLPLSAALLAAVDEHEARRLALTAGDDYELCFTAPASAEPALTEALSGSGCPLTRIGVIEEQPGLRVIGEDGRPQTVEHPGYRHFG